MIFDIKTSVDGFTCFVDPKIRRGRDFAQDAFQLMWDCEFKNMALVCYGEYENAIMFIPQNQLAVYNR